MSNSGSGDGPLGGRRPTPMRPVTGGQRPVAPPQPTTPRRAAPEPEADDGATQAFNLADYELLEADDATASLDQRALLAQATRRPPAEDASKRTILGHPGVSARTANAVRGAGAPPRRSETLAMDGPIGGRGAAARLGSPPPADDDGAESTMALDLEAMFDARADRKPAATALTDDGEATTAMNMDAMLAEIGDDDWAPAGHAAAPAAPAPRQAPAPRAAAPAPAPRAAAPAPQAPAPRAAAPAPQAPAPRAAAPAPAPRAAAPAPPQRSARPAPPDEEEHESTMAVDMDAMLQEVDEDNESTMAMNLDDMADAFEAPRAPAKPARAARPEPEPARAPERAPRQEPARAARAEAAPAPAKRTPAPAAAPAPEAEGMPDASGLLGPVRYALAFDGRVQELNDDLADLDAQLAEGASPRAVAASRQQIEGELASLDPDLAKRGWITLGAIGGGAAALFLVLGLVL